MTNTIEYVKFLNKSQISEYIKNKKSDYEDYKKNRNITIENNEQLLIQEYKNFESQIVQKYTNDLHEFNTKYSLWKEKKCYCGNSLRFFTYHDFWGCKDYKNKKKEHLTFKNDTLQIELFKNQFSNVKVRLNKDWCTAIIVNSGLKGKIKAKDLLVFYQSRGLEDLREKYCYQSTTKTLSAFQLANLESKKEEKLVKSFLEEHFKVLYQPYIEYKYRNSIKKICIPDLIISNNDFVCIIEIKTHSAYVNENQLRLYFDLIAHSQQKNNDLRLLSSAFVVNDIYKSEFDTISCISIEDLTQFNSEEEIIECLIKNKYL